MEIRKKYELGDMIIRYVVDDKELTGIELYPKTKEKQIVQKKQYKVDSMVQWKKSTDAFPYGFANGVTMRNSESIVGTKWQKQEIKESDSRIIIRTYLKDLEGNDIYHTLTYSKGKPSFWVDTEFVNNGETPLTLEMISSFSIGGITPFATDEASNQLRVHKLRSKWSTEGRLETRTIEELLLEPTWSRHGVYSDKFGQTGSLPVRGYFPAVGVEDIKEKVVWAAAIACSSSWQMEVYRRDEALCISGGIADHDFGHWCKTLNKGESFHCVPSIITVYEGGVDQAFQRLSTLWKKEQQRPLPIIFNEFCTTWGEPSGKNISKILKTLKDKPITYFVIDAGWYADPIKGWESNMGDWEISPALFPEGLTPVVEEIRSYGFIPGIWFEIETCGQTADAYLMTDHLLKRNGAVITSGGRRFLDMRDPWTYNYLSHKVIDFLSEYNFGFIKIDYNESIGIGCDGNESLGEGLRQNMLATLRFFQEIKVRIPDITIEICSSGGHRLEPSMLCLADVASFSDAHEEKEIPVIAANIHRLVPPGQSEIWAVLRKEDSLQRIAYSIISTYFGVMCLSGDVFDLSKEQWQMVECGMAFYKKLEHIISDGITYYYGTKQNSWRKLMGWQGIIRYDSKDREALCIIHQFETREETIEIPVRGGYKIHTTYEANYSQLQQREGFISVTLQEEYEAIAIHLMKE